MAANRPLVSVVTATYNRADLVRQTVDSVLAQTYANVEHIIVDDGSTDATPDVMAGYAGRVRYIRQANQGDYGSSAILAGYAASSGRYVCVLDHDDLFMPEKIARQVALLESRQDVSVVHCGYHYIDEHGAYLEKTSQLPDCTLADLVCGDPIWSGAPLIRRSSIEAIGGFDTAWCRDWRTWLRLARHGHKFHCLQAPLGAYRIVPGSMMSNIDKLEHTSIETLDMTFAEADLPSNVASLKPVAYGQMSFFIGCRYIAAGNSADGARNILRAAELMPELKQQNGMLAQLLIDDALSPRVADAVRFLSDALRCLGRHFPELQHSEADLRRKLHMGLAVRSNARGDLDGCREHYALAAQSGAAGAMPEAEFAHLLVDRATRLSVGDPEVFVESALRLLPPALSSLRRVQKRVLGDIYMHQAFASHAAGERGSVVRSVASGLASRPSAALNRGVWSIVLQALMGKTGKQ